MTIEENKEPSVCDDCMVGDYWECMFFCMKCYEDYNDCTYRTDTGNCLANGGFCTSVKLE